jgi:Tfp pilus assembly protein PilF
MTGVPPQLSLPQALERVVSALQSGDLAQAERVCRSILAAEPAQVDALHLLGVTLMRAGRAEAALEPLSRARALDPAFADAAYNHGVALGEVERWSEALAAYDQVVRLDSRNARAWNNRGNVLQKLERWAEAVASYERALALRPDHAEALYNRGLGLLTLGRTREALASLERSVALAPDNGEAQWTKSIAHLLLGEFAEGWRLHEWRWKTRQMAAHARGFREPLWLGGEAIAGRTILLHADQGFGDTLQMARYAPMVEALGARVLLEVASPLVRLMKSLSPTIEVVARETPLPRFDIQCPLGSLPLAFRTALEAIPAAQGYLRAPAQAVAQWKERLGPPGRPRIGLAWSGNPKLQRDRERSIPFATLAPLLGQRFDWHALQTDFRADDEQVARAAGVEIWRDQIRDFADSAALAENLDLVITVDTSVAHLAGALGRPVWILVTWMPDHRWMLGRADTPWYASARLFRQPSAGDWAGAIAEVRRALDARFPAPA